MFFKTPSIFQIICWVAFGSFSIFWIYKYCLNEDLVSVDFTDYYETKEDVLPMLSLCIRNPFSERKLKNLNLDKTSYLKFLLGSWAKSLQLLLCCKREMLCYVNCCFDATGRHRWRAITEKVERGLVKRM